ncbi:hypothetical protein P7K49_004434, partial [Saguinus oedipus]
LIRMCYLVNLEYTSVNEEENLKTRYHCNAIRDRERQEQKTSKQEKELSYSVWRK